MTERNTPEDLNCGFCLQKLTYMIEPKQLPCSHVFCLPCLEEDPKKDCPVCRRVYDAQWTGMKSLLRPSETDSDSTTDNSDHIKCDVCKDQKAVCYCLGCEKKLCDHDFKIHEQSSIYFTSKHHQIDIAVYASNPEKYTPVYCSDHEDQKLTVACYNCHQVFCQACQPQLSNCSKSKDRRAIGFHATSSIAMMSDNMRLELNAQIKKIADQVTEGLNLEKKSWSNLYDVECKVTQMISEIDQRVETAINNIKASAKQMKNELKAHQAKSVSLVEAYSSQLTEQRDRLETQWKELNRRFQDMKGSDIITKFESLKKSIDTSPPVLYKLPPELPCRPKTLTQSPDFKGLIEDELFSPIRITNPMSIELKYLKTLPSNGMNVFSVTWHGKDIVCGTNKGVLIHNKHLQKRQVYIRGAVDCIRRIDKYAFAILYSKDDTEREVRISCKNTLADPKTTLCKFSQDNKYLLHLSIGEEYVAACDFAEGIVHVWTIKGEHLMELGSGHLEGPTGVLLQHDSILVSDYRTGCLHKFRLQTDSQPVWTCQGLHTPYGICVDKQGLIYVTSDLGNTIHLITQEGILTNTLHCDELSKTENVLDISLSEDGKTVALACKNEGVKLFSLKS